MKQTQIIKYKYTFMVAGKDFELISNQIFNNVGEIKDYYRFRIRNCGLSAIYYFEPNIYDNRNFRKVDGLKFFTDSKTIIKLPNIFDLKTETKISTRVCYTQDDVLLTVSEIFDLYNDLWE